MSQRPMTRVARDLTPVEPSQIRLRLCRNYSCPAAKDTSLTQSHFFKPARLPTPTKTLHPAPNGTELWVGTPPPFVFGYFGTFVRQVLRI